MVAPPREAPSFRTCIAISFSLFFLRAFSVLILVSWRLILHWYLWINPAEGQRGGFLDAAHQIHALYRTPRRTFAEVINRAQ